MMRRRDVIALIGALVLGPAVPVQSQTQRKPLIGVLWHAGSEEEEAPYLAALREGLRQLGHIPDRNLVLESRFPAEQYERFQSLAADLVALKPDVIVAVTPAAALAAQRATTTIPIVFVLVADPVGMKLVDSWSRPGLNITGLSQMGLDLSAKRLELLTESVPGISRVALLVNPADPSQPPILRETENAGRALGVMVLPIEVAARDAFAPAFERMRQNRVQGVIVPPDGLFFRDRELIADLALRHRLPAIFWSRETVGAGGFASYGPSVPALFRRAAVYVDKILKGENPGDLPVEQPTRYETIINLKTVKALGLEVPLTLLARADEVIE